MLFVLSSWRFLLLFFSQESIVIIDLVVLMCSFFVVTLDTLLSLARSPPTFAFFSLPLCSGWRPCIKGAPSICCYSGYCNSLSTIFDDVTHDTYCKYLIVVCSRATLDRPLFHSVSLSSMSIHFLRPVKDEETPNGDTVWYTTSWPLACVSMCQHVSAYDNKSTCVSKAVRLMCHHVSSYVSISQHKSGNL